MALTTLERWDSAIVSTYKTKIKGKDETCFAGKFIAGKNPAQVFVKDDYSRIIVAVGDDKIFIKTKNITPRDRDDFYVGRTDSWKVVLSKSKYYDEKPDVNPEYYVKLFLLDSDQRAEEEANEKEYAKKEAEYAKSKEVTVDFDEEIDI